MEVARHEVLQGQVTSGLEGNVGLVFYSKCESKLGPSQGMNYLSRTLSIILLLCIFHRLAL